MGMGLTLDLTGKGETLVHRFVSKSYCVEEPCIQSDIPRNERSKIGID